MIRNTMESTVTQIIQHIKDNIDSSLADLRTDRTDNKVNTNPPVDYFPYAKAVGYRVPCVFVIGRNVQFLQERGQNHINAQITAQVSVVLEDQESERLTYKCWRYADAMHAILDQVELISTNLKIKNKIKVTSSEFGDAVQIKSQVESPFRMETMLMLEIEHYEQM